MSLETNLDFVQRALDHDQRLSLHYRDVKGKETDRVVNPRKLEYVNGNPRLTAFCEQEGRLLRFRVDRMSKIKILD
ncbi:WYL domain-containing protein [Cloacibacillus evryensis]|uniref:WYL domain-containing protein n=1 Tax=Cloacibacillus evryensis TaxID=508460 RepID=UPI000240D84F|nr:WYL domain-containing protein [Cloacibacillus evryensis]EHL67227.1 hypothetical protein HMPREF1006_01297 [Synergistes sp. 3_1_syn1]